MMFFYISKVIGYLLDPLIWIIFLFLLGIFTRNSKKKHRYYIAAAISLWLFSNAFLVDEVARLWEKPIKSNSHPKYDIGILLTGDIATFDNLTQRVIFRSGSDRVLQTVYLYNQGVIDKILISGGSGSLVNRDISEAAHVGDYLTSIGIDNEDIIIESRSRNTNENALYTVDMLKAMPSIKTVLLITSSLHMRRAEACFIKQGTIIDTYTTSKITGERNKRADQILVPSAASLVKWNKLLHEIVGYIVYKIMGYC